LDISAILNPKGLNLLDHRMKRKRAILSLAVLVAVSLLGSACSPTEEGAFVGGALGAAAGGAITDSAGGALVGGLLGAAAGAAIADDRYDRRYRRYDRGRGYGGRGYGYYDHYHYDDGYYGGGYHRPHGGWGY